MLEREAVELQKRVFELAAVMFGITGHGMARKRMRLVGERLEPGWGYLELAHGQDVQDARARLAPASGRR